MKFRSPLRSRHRFRRERRSDGADMRCRGWRRGWDCGGPASCWERCGRSGTCRSSGFGRGIPYGQSFPFFAVEVVAMSVALAWLWAKTGGSLLLPMLLHAAVNNSKDIVPSAELGAAHVFGLSHSPVAWLTAVVLWVCAAYFLARMPKTHQVHPDYRAASS